MHEADLAIEDSSEGVVSSVVFQIQFGYTAQAARRLMQNLLGHAGMVGELYARFSA